MKTILFDFITFEDSYVNGGALTVKSILFDLAKKNCRIIGLCRKVDNVNSEIQKFSKSNGIAIIEIENDIEKIVKRYNVDCLFIGIGQRFADISLTNVSCKIYMIIHDIGDICMYNADVLYRIDDKYKLYILNKKKLPKLRCLKLKIKNIIEQKTLLGLKMSVEKQQKYFGYTNLSKLLKKNNVQVITVSEYSRNALEYYFDDIANKIKVLYPYPTARNVENMPLEFSVNNFGEYFLFMNAERYNKNVSVFIRQFKKLNERYANRFKAVILGLNDINCENIYAIPKVNDYELEQLQRNCFALVYASFSEGFGMPPIEVMSYGRPVIAAFSTSIPEICGDAVLYFNPAYQEDLFLKEIMLIENYDKYASRVKDHALKIVERQHTDGERLLDLLIKQ